jgi:hypothetical protein
MIDMRDKILIQAKYKKGSVVIVGREVLNYITGKPGHYIKEAEVLEQGEIKRGDEKIPYDLIKVYYSNL